MSYGVLSRLGLVSIIACSLGMTGALAQEGEVESERFTECKTWNDNDRAIGGAALQKAFDCLFAKIDKLENELRPFKRARGAVLAFDRNRNTEAVCPRGWSYFHPAGGRFVVGAGQHENGLTEYPAHTEDNNQAIGGEEAVVLKLDQIPSHTHVNGNFRFLLSMDGQNTAIQTDPNVGQANIVPAKEMLPAGGGGAHNNMPPFVALYYCKKDS